MQLEIMKFYQRQENRELERRKQLVKNKRGFLARLVGLK
tara:strand:- start:547 stop:663 length:117 start_codon:yes stop_codon:yes gene_type:complete